MNLELYQPMTLPVDLPEYHLTTGQSVMLIDYVSHPQGGETGCILEVFDDSGESIAVVTVPQSSLERPTTAIPPSLTVFFEPLVPARDGQTIGPDQPVRVYKPAPPKRSPVEAEGIQVHLWR
jgi:hypothetical protein